MRVLHVCNTTGSVPGLPLFHALHERARLPLFHALHELVQLGATPRDAHGAWAEVSGRNFPSIQPADMGLVLCVLPLDHRQLRLRRLLHAFHFRFHALHAFHVRLHALHALRASHGLL